MSKTTVYKNKGFIESGDNKITATRKRFKIGEIKPENFYMNSKLTKSRNGNYYGELLYLHEGRWYKPIIILPQMNGCRFYTNQLGITTLVGNLSPENTIQRKTAERIVQIHSRVQTIIKHHPRLKLVKGEFPITRFLRRRVDKLIGEVTYMITAEVEEKRVQNGYTFNGTTFVDKNKRPLKGNPILDFKNKELDVFMSIDLSFINIGKNSNKQDAIYNKIKAVTIMIKEARENIQDDDSDEDVDSEDDLND